MKTLLVVVDMQNDFVDGALGSDQAKMIVLNVKKLMDDIFDETNGQCHLIVTKDTHYADYMETNEGKHLPVPHCIKDTEGWDLNRVIRDECLFFRHGKKIITKPTFGSIEFADILRQPEYDDLDEIVFCGLCTDICVVSNVLIAKATRPETEIKVYADCCAGVTPEKHEAALDTMESCQITVVNRGKEPWKTV